MKCQSFKIPIQELSWLIKTIQKERGAVRLGKIGDGSHGINMNEVLRCLRRKLEGTTYNLSERTDNIRWTVRNMVDQWDPVWMLFDEIWLRHVWKGGNEERDHSRCIRKRNDHSLCTEEFGISAPAGRETICLRYIDSLKAFVKQKRKKSFCRMFGCYDAAAARMAVCKDLVTRVDGKPALERNVREFLCRTAAVVCHHNWPGSKEVCCKNDLWPKQWTSIYSYSLFRKERLKFPKGKALRFFKLLEIFFDIFKRVWQIRKSQEPLWLGSFSV